MNILIRKVKSSNYAQVAVVFLLAGLSSYVLGRLVINPQMSRFLIFAVLFLISFAISLKKPRVVLVGLLLYLPFMGFFRRLLIPHAGWSQFDPLVLLAPVIVLMLGSYWLYRTYMQRQIIEDDSTLFKLIRVLVLLEVLQILNPLQGSIMVGFGGILFYIVPLAWMLMGRLYMNLLWMKRIFMLVVVIGVISLLYSYKQVNYGFFSFEEAWIELGGYAALMVGQGARGFSFFTSASEYAQYITFGAVICWGLLLQGKKSFKLAAIILLPLFFYAIMMTGSRGPLLFTIVAIAIMTIMSVRQLKTRVLVTGLVAFGLVFTYQFIISIDASNNELIARQVNGFANPTDEKHSTLGLHWAIFVEGIKNGFSNPIGDGLGSTTLAGKKFSENHVNSEVDLSNMFTSLGLFGGILYMFIIFHVLKLAFRHCRDGVVFMSILGILICSIGSWAIGGNYSTAILIWLCIGFLDRYKLS
ncbi:O-antigen ligase family protein [Paenibacillus sp. 1P07SE]|uniref:O-antigen ligase family protein n=1 Tax=Paenibacillus sp. 1P07SE TaxID=3132209 RepID=UPI0039A53C9A